MPNADRECNSPHAVECRADNPVSSTMAANRTEITPKRGLSAAPAHAGSPAARHRRNAGRFDPFFPVPASNDGRAARTPRRNRWTSLASMGTNLRRCSTHEAMTRLPIEFCSQGAI